MTSAPRPGIVKKVLSAGRGPLPDFAKDTRVQFHYEVLAPKCDTAKEGFPDEPEQFDRVDDSRKPWPHGYGEPMELVIGRKFQLPVLETCVQSMHVDEISQFDVEMRQMATFPMVAQKLRDIARQRAEPNFHSPHQHHCAGMGMPQTGYPELDALIENPKDLRVIIHLLKVEQPADYQVDNWQLDSKERLAKVEQCRLAGNKAVQEGALEQAIEEYRQAVTLLDQLMLLEKPGDEEWEQLNQKTVPIYSNLAHCYLTLGRSREAENAASEALKRCPTHEKALFRRSKALTALDEFDQAEADLTALLSAHPHNDKLVNEERRRLSALRDRKRADQDKLFKKMLA